MNEYETIYIKDSKIYRNVDGEWVEVKDVPDLSEELNNEELFYA